jgi:hypothetical protein
MKRSHGKIPDHVTQPEEKGKGERIRKEKAKEKLLEEVEEVPKAPELYWSFKTIRAFGEENSRHRSQRAYCCV